MAGTIELGPGLYWSAAGWLFRWVLTYVRASVRDPATAIKLEEIVQENLGYFSVDELSSSGRADFFDAICGSLVDDWERQLRADFPNREDIARHLRELVALACGGDRLQM